MGHRTHPAAHRLTRALIGLLVSLPTIGWTDTATAATINISPGGNISAIARSATGSLSFTGGSFKISCDFTLNGTLTMSMPLTGTDPVTGTIGAITGGSSTPSGGCPGARRLQFLGFDWPITATYSLATSTLRVSIVGWSRLLQITDTIGCLWGGMLTARMGTVSPISIGSLTFATADNSLPLVARLNDPSGICIGSFNVSGALALNPVERLTVVL